MRTAFFFAIIFSAIMAIHQSCAPTSPGFSRFEEYPYYPEDDLGLRYTPSKSVFKLWAPTANAARISFYEQDMGGEP
ncbi:MAG TPA: hypothetical protein PK198_05095, partial [Saprospiraceae bacterium]|nr:hypothetical protein [Saprospiraceae bacterium]